MGIEELLLDRAEKQGVKQGMEQMKKEDHRKFTLNLLTHTDFSDEQIAKLAEVSKEYVAKLRKSLK
jgi:molybdenum cofactor biosynthesis enzyme MoaA